MSRADDTPADRLFLQAAGVLVEGIGVLIRGPSGSGKSDLALRLIDGGASLVADDGVELRRVGERLILCLPPVAPAATRGRLEARGLGILPVPSTGEATLGLVVELVPPGTAAALERLPQPATISLLGLVFPLIRLSGLEASAPAKVRLAVRAASGFIIAPP